MSITLSSINELSAAIRRASHVEFGSFVLGGGPVRDALAAAAERGADVDVVLARRPYATGAGGARENAGSAEILRDAGAHVTLMHGRATWFHVKGAVCDGVAYLDDRNFPRTDQTVLRDDDPNDVALVSAAIHGTGTTSPTLATEKDDALWQEANLIRGATGKPVIVETETFGPGIVSSALRLHAQSGAPTTLIVSPEVAAKPQTRAMLRGMRSAGVEVHETGSSEKCALAGDTVWVGSANASFAFGDAGKQIDWGVVTREPHVVDAVRAALARDLGRTPLRASA